MSEKENNYMVEAIKALKNLPPAQQSMCTGFVLGICAAGERKEESA